MLYPIVLIYSSTCVSSVLNLGKFVGKCGEWLVEDVRKMWRERGGESCRKMRREVVGRCGERDGEICRKVRRERWRKL